MAADLLYILPSLATGGAEIRGVERLNYLAVNYDVSVTLVVLSDNVPIIEDVDKRINSIVLGLKNAEYFDQAAYFSGFKNALRLRKLIKQLRPKVIVASLPISHHLARLAIVFLKIRPKLLLYHHATQNIENPIKTLAQRFVHKQTRFLSRHLDGGHIFISEAVKKDISQNLRVRNGYVLYNAIPDNYALLKKNDRVFNRDHFNIVIPGRLTKVKGHVQALTSILPFIKANSKLLIWIIGDGDEKGNIQHFVESNHLKDQVILLGNFPNLKLLVYLYQCDLVIIPSLSEGLGNVAIEGLMVGAKMIVSDAGGLKEIINQEGIGYIYEKDKPQELLKLLKYVYENPEELRRTEIRNAYLKRFTLHNHVEAFYNLINF